mgnify:FL=1
MKEGRRAGGITAGPESKVLDGPTWDEARQMQMEGKTVVDHGVDFRVGAASKGIIQRDFQHHATVFKSAYAKNPFDNISEDELAEYKRIIDAKSRGDGNSNFFILDNCNLILIFQSLILPWQMGVPIRHLKVMMQQVRLLRRLVVLETITHFRLFYPPLLILNTPLVSFY